MRVLVLAILLVIVGCDSSRIYEENADLPKAIWREDSIKAFQFQIEDAMQPYNLYVNITNKVDYPYYNLYYRYWLADSLNRSLKTGLMNADLFDAKSGEPKGSGVGDIFDHQSPILENYTFPSEGTYSISFQQYMRTDSLPGIRSVGTRVEIALEK